MPTLKGKLIIRQFYALEDQLEVLDLHVDLVLDATANCLTFILIMKYPMYAPVRSEDVT
jgi:hypothetical protein